MGFTWQDTQTLSSSDVDLILALNNALTEREQEEQVRLQTQMMGRMPKF